MVCLDLDVLRDQDPTAFSPAHPFPKEQFSFLLHNSADLAAYF